VNLHVDHVDCVPSRLSQHVINKCHYSFDQTFPSKCKWVSLFIEQTKCFCFFLFQVNFFDH